MQAWQQVKVNNPNSEHNGRAGLVERVETKGDAEIVFVKLDASNATDTAPAREAQLATFDPSELQPLYG